MITLSEREHLVAEQYCKGLADKEVADSLQRSEWTIKAQKRDIYKKTGYFQRYRACIIHVL